MPSPARNGACEGVANKLEAVPKELKRVASLKVKGPVWVIEKKWKVEVVCDKKNKDDIGVVPDSYLREVRSFLIQVVSVNTRVDHFDSLTNQSTLQRILEPLAKSFFELNSMPESLRIAKKEDPERAGDFRSLVFAQATQPMAIRSRSSTYKTCVDSGFQCEDESLGIYWTNDRAKLRLLGALVT